MTQLITILAVVLVVFWLFRRRQHQGVEARQHGDRKEVTLSTANGKVPAQDAPATATAVHDSPNYVLNTYTASKETPAPQVNTVPEVDIDKAEQLAAECGQYLTNQVRADSLSPKNNHSPSHHLDDETEKIAIFQPRVDAQVSRIEANLPALR